MAIEGFWLEFGGSCTADSLCHYLASGAFGSRTADAPGAELRIYGAFPVPLTGFDGLVAIEGFWFEYGGSCTAESLCHYLEHREPLVPVPLMLPCRVRGQWSLSLDNYS